MAITLNQLRLTIKEKDDYISLDFIDKKLLDQNYDCKEKREKLYQANMVKEVLI